MDKEVKVFVNGWDADGYGQWYGASVKIIREHMDKGDEWPNWVKKLLEAVKAYEDEQYQIDKPDARIKE